MEADIPDEVPVVAERPTGPLFRAKLGAFQVESREPLHRPKWLVVGTYVLAAGLIAAGAVLAFARTSDDIGVVLLIGFGLVLSVLNAALGGRSTFDRYADQIRDRIDEDAASIIVHLGGTAHVYHNERIDPATARASNTLEKQEGILREIYTQGLAQAKLSFRVSLIFMTLGAGVLLTGAALAILKAPTTGDRYASIVVSLAGVVINLTSSVFFVQSNRARKNMGDQGVLLREESQEDRRLSAARELAAAIEDEPLRNEVRADLARQLLRASGRGKKSTAGGGARQAREDLPNEGARDNHAPHSRSHT